MGFVYKITSPSGRVYIGSTTKTLKERWRAYKALKCKIQPLLYRSLKKYGVENHIFEQVIECDNKDVLKYESYYGILYNVLDKRVGLNCRIPKEDEEHISISDDTREKIRIGLIGNKNGVGKRSEEFCKKLSKICTGRKGAPKTEIQKQHHSMVMKGYNFGEQFAKDIAIRQSKPVIQYTLDNTYIHEYPSAKQAFLETRIYNISAVCRGERDNAGGFIWKYKNSS